MTVDAARAEATALGHALAMGWLGRTALESSFVGSLPTVDFDGAPSFHLVFVARSASITSPLAFAAANTASLREPGLGSFTMVGATEDQPEIGMQATSLSVLDDLRLTMSALGGEAQLDAIVAPAAGVLVLRDRSGNYWDVDSHAKLDAAEVEARREEYRRAAAQDDDQERASARAIWESHRVTDGVTLESVTQNGHLDLASALAATRATDSTEALSVRTAAQVEHQGAVQTSRECKRFLFVKRCEDIEEGHLSNPELTQAHYPKQPDGFSAPRCIAGGLRDRDDNASLGCGPAAVIGTVWTSWRNGAYFAALEGQTREGLESYMTTHLTAPYQAFSRLIGQDLMNAMGTCSFGDNGSATLPGGFLDGTNAWLAANGSQQRMHMVRGGGNRNEKADVLHARMGVGEQPIIAGFDLGFASSHWSPVSRYRIVRGHGPLNRTQVFIQSIDYEDRWYELFGIKLIKALAWLEGPTGAVGTGGGRGDGVPGADGGSPRPSRD